MSARGGEGARAPQTTPSPPLSHMKPRFLVVQGPTRPCWFLGTRPRALNFQKGRKQSPSALSLQPPALPAPSGSASGHHLRERVLGGPGVPQQRPGGLPAGVRALHPVDGECGPLQRDPKPALCGSAPPSLHRVQAMSLSPINWRRGRAEGWGRAKVKQQQVEGRAGRRPRPPLSLGENC